TPAVIGAVVVLGGGGAAVAVFGGGGKGTRQVAPSVRADPASRPADTGGARTASGPSRRETGAVRIGAHTTAIDPTKAGVILDALIDRPPGGILDSAQLVYNAAGAGQKASA